MHIMCFKIVKKRTRRDRLWFNPMPMRILFMQKLDRIHMIFWWMDTKLMMIDFHHLGIKQALEGILISQYINMDGSVTVYTILWKKAVNMIQRNLMRQMNNMSVS